MGVKRIEAGGDDSWLPKHTESIIYSEQELLRYFALGGGDVQLDCPSQGVAQAQLIELSHQTELRVQFIGQLDAQRLDAGRLTVGLHVWNLLLGVDATGHPGESDGNGRMAPRSTAPSGLPLDAGAVSPFRP